MQELNRWIYQQIATYPYFSLSIAGTLTLLIGFLTLQQTRLFFLYVRSKRNTLKQLAKALSSSK